jgi:hypothetical protein
LRTAFRRLVSIGWAFPAPFCLWIMREEDPSKHPVAVPASQGLGQISRRDRGKDDQEIPSRFLGLN